MTFVAVAGAVAAATKMGLPGDGAPKHYSNFRGAQLINHPLLYLNRPLWKACGVKTAADRSWAGQASLHKTYLIF